ncbi:PhnD/SsuA/transferrin family substrate-binding protein [uncultured Cohaesibacter sp.]|uniref:sensor histidine kinase n=1 Tax=uncultured Cohaesibacter sp. TaxID=1002546 RepID=UPI002AA94351|nr:PhnD/SsuA/transferrin family substrate-binding protein [uncultured Cohaesibacter sp.]
MQSNFPRPISFCALLIGLWCAITPATAETIKRIGVLDYLGAKHSLTHWAQTAASLNAAFPDVHFELEALDIDGLDAALSAGELDFVLTNPGNYAELEFRHHISRIATAEEDQPVASTLVTSRDFESMEDLVGKKLAVMTTEAFGGFQVIWAEMHKQDPTLPRRVELVQTGYPMQKVAEAVLSGKADAAVMRTCTLELLQQQNPTRYGALHAFALRHDMPTDCAISSPIYPNWPFAKTPKTDAAFAKAVAVKLLSIKEGNLWTVPLDYQSVHDVLRQLQIGPYARTGPISLSDFIEDYRDWLIILAGALIFWAIYSVRIESLVRKRTRDLKEANEKLRLEMVERKRAEEADRQHQRELEHVARLSILGEMASSIAHELNQPLAAISNYAQGCLLRIKADRFSREDMELASGEIAQQAQRAAEVVKRIRAFVRKKESRPVTITVPELVEDCAAVYAASANHAGVRVILDLTPGLPPLRVDPIQIQQVVLNLVQNAIDAMSAEATERREAILSVREKEEGRRGILLSVRDFGHGMDTEGLGHFAEAFYTTKTEGIGLGLALSRSIVEAHGGSMRAFTPSDGTGLEVAIWLPAGENA